MSQAVSSRRVAETKQRLTQKLGLARPDVTSVCPRYLHIIEPHIAVSSADSEARAYDEHKSAFFDRLKRHQHYVGS